MNVETEIAVIKIKLKTNERLLYLILGAILAVHLIDPVAHFGFLQFP